ncbi:hypothetical protein PAMP_023669 [Pampus punctatissimus]
MCHLCALYFVGTVVEPGLFPAGPLVPRRAVRGQHVSWRMSHKDCCCFRFREAGNRNINIHRQIQLITHNSCFKSGV